MKRWVCGISASITSSYSRRPSKRRYSAFGRLPVGSTAEVFSSLTASSDASSQDSKDRASVAPRAAGGQIPEKLGAPLPPLDAHSSLVTEGNVAGTIPLVQQPGCL